MIKPFLWLSMALICTVGCKQHVTDEHKHEHEVSSEAPSLESIAYTLYSEKTELFVEFSPFVLDGVSKFATHLTVIGNEFKALTEAKVTVSLLVGDTGIRSNVDKASSPGIFKLALKPAVVGKGKLVFDIVAKDFTDQFIIDNVTVHADEDQAIRAQVAAGPSDEISYLKEQAWKVSFANNLVKKQNFNATIRANGRILGAPGDEIVVSAKANGIIKLTNKNVIAGQPIKAGANMFTITGGDLAKDNIDANYQQAKALFDEAKINFDRAQELVKDKIISDRDFLSAKVAYENATIALTMMGKNYSNGGQRNGAPISGFVKNILVTDGQFVSIGTPLATITKNRKLLLEANVSQKDFNIIPTIRSANFKLHGNEKVYDTEKLNGRVASYGKTMHENSSFIPIVFEIDNTENFVSGSAVQVYIKSTSIPNVLVIPNTALIEEQGSFYVYVQTSGERFQKREIKLGTTDGQNVQVVSGIVEGERVVTKGAYQIKLSSASGALPAHGHQH